MWQSILHYSLHLLLPLGAALLFYRRHWQRAFLLMFAMMVVDVDHLFATPMFNPERCSIGFHFMHSYWAISFYTVLLFFKPFRIFALGLLLHMVADGVDCLMM